MGCLKEPEGMGGWEGEGCERVKVSKDGVSQRTRGVGGWEEEG